MEKKQNYTLLFVGGDLSGIQKFLYNISSKKAAVSLKGRSYYLQQYMESVCEEIKQAAASNGANSTKVIYCSGGKFYVITENQPQVVKAINECAQKAKQELWKEHMGQLGLNISHVAFSENPDGSVDCQDQCELKPGYLWKVVNADFAKQKQQKFKDQLIDDYQQFFEPILVGGKPKVCAITGIESPDCVKMDNEDFYVLPIVRQQIQLGEKLRKQEHFKTFEEYAEKTYLGVLRMDVDGLGKRFIEGFNSIEKYEEFSNRLVVFFEKEIRSIQQEPTYKDYLNIIYAGGDDLFVVGQWDKLIDFAERIHKEVAQQFQDEGISISGGIAIVKPKYPIAKAAELAGDAEDAAKQFRNGEKNAFHLLGKTISWNKEFDYVKSLMQQFVYLINEYGLSKGILHKLMLYSSIADRNKVLRQEGKNEDFSYIWHISYYLTRYMNRYKGNKAVYDFCRSLRDRELDYKNGRNLELIALAARWAELVIKDEIYN
jgi:CRISPR/Cas system-associated protein Cas10 (large subunit of type III CRISPR-Cas system)